MFGSFGFREPRAGDGLGEGLEGLDELDGLEGLDGLDGFLD